MNAEIGRLIEAAMRYEEQERNAKILTVSGIYQSFGKPVTFVVMQLLANAITSIEQTTNTDWREDPLTFKQVANACTTILKLFRNDRKETLPAPEIGFIASESAVVGADIAKEVLDEWVGQINLAKAMRAKSEAIEDGAGTE